MKPRSHVKATWKFGGREFLYSLLGIIIYAATSWATNFAQLNALEVSGVLRPGIGVPIFFGFVFGPIVGFLVGAIGNLLVDFTIGFAAIPAAGSTFPEVLASLSANWQVGNGLIGLVPGIAATIYRRYFSFNDIIRALVITAVAIVIGIGFAAALDPLVFSPAITGSDYYSGVYSADLQLAVRDSFIPIVTTNIVNAFLVLPLLLFNYERLDLSSQNNLFSSGLMRRLLLTITVSSAVPIIILALFLIQSQLSRGESGITLVIQLVFTIIITTVFIITNAALMAQSITTPLLRLTSAAQAMEQGELTEEEATELEKTTGSDEIANLSHIFGQMAKEVINRVQKLRDRVAELQIIVDEGKREESVKEIVETEFFQDLRDKAKNMRQRRKKLESGLSTAEESFSD